MVTIQPIHHLVNQKAGLKAKSKPSFDSSGRLLNNRPFKHLNNVFRVYSSAFDSRRQLRQCGNYHCKSGDRKSLVKQKRCRSNYTDRAGTSRRPLVSSSYTTANKETDEFSDCFDSNEETVLPTNKNAFEYAD